MLSHAKEGGGTSEERVARQKLVRQKPTLPVLPEVDLQEPIIITNNGKYLWSEHIDSTVGNFMLLHSYHLGESCGKGGFSSLPCPPMDTLLCICSQITNKLGNLKKKSLITLFYVFSLTWSLHHCFVSPVVICSTF
jgi:hypothetical protein